MPGARPQPRGVREDSVGDLPRQGVFHEHDDARAVHTDGFHEKEDEAGVVGGLPGPTCVRPMPAVTLASTVTCPFCGSEEQEPIP